MKISNVYVVGLGGTGSFLAEPLVRLLTFHNDGREAIITFVDGDKYEGEIDHLNPGNHSRQIFSPSQNGKYKASVTKSRLNFLNENLKCQVMYLDSDSLRTILEDIDSVEGINLFLLTLDNHASRRAIITTLYNWNKDWLVITPGNNLDKGQVNLCGIIDGKEVGTNPMTIYPDMANPTDSIPTMRKTCMIQAISTPQLISANMLAATVSLLQVQAILDNKDIFDEIHFDVYKMKVVPGNKVPYLY